MGLRGMLRWGWLNALAITTIAGCYTTHGTEHAPDAGAAAWELDAERGENDGPPRLIRVSRGPATGDLEACDGDGLFESGGVAGAITSDGSSAEIFATQRVSSCLRLDFDRPAAVIAVRARAAATACGSTCQSRCDEYSMLYPIAGDRSLGAMTLDPVDSGWHRYELAAAAAATWYLCRPDYDMDGPIAEIDYVEGLR
jgi:hypothetical protein